MLQILTVFAQESLPVVPIVVGVLAMIVILVGMWKVFEKAGQPGWACIVPIYNTWVMVKIAGKDVVWFILFFVPCLNIIAAIVVTFAIAERFGKGSGFGLGLLLFGFIFFPILGFGDAQYQPAPTAQ